MSSPPATMNSSTGTPASRNDSMISAGAEGGGLEQRPVDLVRLGRQPQPEHQPGQVVVDQHRAVSAVPVERHQPVRAHRLLGRLLGEQLVHRPALLVRQLGDLAGDGVVDEPAEDVADAALAGLVAPQPLDDAAVDHPAHARDLGELVGRHHVTGGRAHDRDHLAGVDRLGGRRGGVRVEVADGDRDALGQAGPPGRLRGEAACPGAQLGDLVLDQVAEEAAEAVGQLLQVLLGRVLAVLTDRLVAGRAGVAHVPAGQLPDDPVGRLDEVVGALVGLAVLLEQLQPLRQRPLRRQPARRTAPATAPRAARPAR